MLGIRVSGPDGERAERVALATAADGRRWLAWTGGVAEVGEADGPRASVASARATPLASPRACAPCAGRVASVSVAVGEAVAKGQQLATVEAMKMEFSLLAAIDGRVEAVPVSVGQVLEKGALVVQIAPLSAAADPPGPA